MNDELENKISHKYKINKDIIYLIFSTGFSLKETLKIIYVIRNCGLDVYALLKVLKPRSASKNLIMSLKDTVNDITKKEQHQKNIKLWKNRNKARCRNDSF